MTQNNKKCPDCLAHYTGQHTCPHWMKELVKRHNAKDDETHNVCDNRLKKEGGQARCCDCEPHEDCNLYTMTQKTSDNQPKAGEQYLYRFGWFGTSFGGFGAFLFGKDYECVLKVSPDPVGTLWFEDNGIRFDLATYKNVIRLKLKKL